MRGLKKTVMIMASVFALTACAKGEQVSVKIGTGGTGGNYYKFANNISDAMKSDSFGLEFEVKTTAGSAANVRLLSGNFLDAAIVQSDILELASKGTEMFSDKTYSGYSAVAALYTEAIQIVVSADSDIYTIADLKSKSVSVGEEDSGVVYDAKQILDISGLDFDDIDAHYMSFSESADAMRMGTIDAFFVTAGAPTQAIKELAEEKNIRLLSFKDDELKRILNKYSGYTTCTIPADTYKGQTEAVTTLGVKAVLVVNNKLGDDTVKKLTEAVFKYSSKLKDYSNTDGDLTVEAATSSVPISFHPGAASYYSDKGTTVKSSNGSNNNGINAGQDD